MHYYEVLFCWSVKICLSSMYISHITRKVLVLQSHETAKTEVNRTIDDNLTNQTDWLIIIGKAENWYHKETKLNFRWVQVCHLNTSFYSILLRPLYYEFVDVPPRTIILMKQEQFYMESNKSFHVPCFCYTHLNISVYFLILTAKIAQFTITFFKQRKSILLGFH